MRSAETRWKTFRKTLMNESSTLTIKKHTEKNFRPNFSKEISSKSYFYFFSSLLLCFGLITWHFNYHSLLPSSNSSSRETYFEKEKLSWAECLLFCALLYLQHQEEEISKTHTTRNDIFSRECLSNELWSERTFLIIVARSLVCRAKNAPCHIPKFCVASLSLSFLYVDDDMKKGGKETWVVEAGARAANGSAELLIVLANKWKVKVVRERTRWILLHIFKRFSSSTLVELCFTFFAFIIRYDSTGITMKIELKLSKTSSIQIQKLHWNFAIYNRPICSISDAITVFCGDHS